jgi:Kef-type K+ transport system membrane component KefB
MDEIPFLVVLIRKIRAAVIWIVAAILAILLIIDYMENEEVASILTSVLIFLFIVIFLNYLFKKFFSQSSKDKE